MGKIFGLLIGVPLIILGFARFFNLPEQPVPGVPFFAIGFHILLTVVIFMTGVAFVDDVIRKRTK